MLAISRKSSLSIAMCFTMGCVFLSTAIPVSATLIDRGNGLIYDDAQNITWLQDANYAFTSGYASANEGPSQVVSEELSAATTAQALAATSNAGAQAAVGAAAQLANEAAATAQAAQQAAAGAESAAAGAASAAAGAQAGAVTAASSAAGAVSAAAAGTGAPAGATAAVAASQQSAGAAAAAQAAANAAAQPGATAIERATAVATAQAAANAANNAFAAAKLAEQQAAAILQDLIDDYENALTGGSGLSISGIQDLLDAIQELEDTYDDFLNASQAAEQARQEANLASAASQQAAAADANASSAAEDATEAVAQAQQAAAGATSAAAAAVQSATELEAANTRLLQAQAALSSDPGHINADGSMGWEAANAWVDQLTFGGFDEWRLFTNSTSCLGNSCGTLGNELAHLYAVDMGLSSGALLSSNSLGIFENLQDDGYWSNQLLGGDPTLAIGFNGSSGNQSAFEISTSFFAWAVLDGDVTTNQPSSVVPEPTTGALFSLGILALLIGSRRLDMLPWREKLSPKQLQAIVESSRTDY